MLFIHRLSDGRCICSGQVFNDLSAAVAYRDMNFKDRDILVKDADERTTAYWLWNINNPVDR